MLADTPMKLTEAELWTNARDIVHFVGICGAGKSTLSSRLAARIAKHGGKAIGTIDYDPLTPDDQRQSDRAFSRELDHLNNAAGGRDPDVLQKIVDHSLALIESWVRSDANVVLVDRWWESFDYLPTEHARYIETAIRSSGFRMRHVLLVVVDGVFGSEENAIRQRMLHTKGTRPAEWWATGPDALDVWVREELAYQDAYRLFVHRSPFESTTLNTIKMDWADYEDSIVSSLIEGRWLEAFDKAEIPGQGSDAAPPARLGGVAEQSKPLEPQECTYAHFRQMASGRQYGPFDGEPAKTMVWFRGSVLRTVDSLGDEALREAHRLAVHESLYMNSDASSRDFFRKQVCLPSKAALDEYPSLREQFPIESAQVDAQRTLPETTAMCAK
ncbi:hypothetical protein [Paraburkholderia fungorum]|uniref:hypothetical protein n=1 Tax=Paraburkholderia fungorum TaxID=134537 RepID=UPI0016138D48|nr:hypothetical protein [Paraburkholderia fungorum]MBB5546617.1 hypothetical protein [Paraburkholderia fungorum]